MAWLISSSRINDILSLKKEMVRFPFPIPSSPYTDTMLQATGCVVNLVPVLYQAGQSLEEVIPYLTEEMHASRDRLDAAAEKLDPMTKKDTQLNKTVKEFIDGIRRMVTGTLEYS